MDKRKPRVGELWKLTGGGRLLVVLGNCLGEGETIWCADDSTGERVDAPVNGIEFYQARDIEQTVNRCKAWARLGINEAAWWLGWWYEGRNHPKSVWYYLTALRLSPEIHGWAFSRIYEDARRPGLCAGVPVPDLSFLSEIDEFNQVKNAIEPVAAFITWGDWKDAVKRAEFAAHIPANLVVVS